MLIYQAYSVYTLNNFTHIQDTTLNIDLLLIIKSIPLTPIKKQIKLISVPCHF